MLMSGKKIQEDKNITKAVSKILYSRWPFIRFVVNISHNSISYTP